MQNVHYPHGESLQATRLAEVELSQPLQAIASLDERTGRSYERVSVLVRLHTLPIGTIDLDITEGLLPVDRLCAEIWRALHEEINSHLLQDGLAAASSLSDGGLPVSSCPACGMEREELLKNAPLISVAIATRDRPDTLPKTLDSLLALNYPNYEIIVVDNAPKTSATADLVREKYGEQPRVRYVQEQRPGLSWARNCGLRHARGEIIAYTDDDVLVDPNWLVEFLRGFHAADNVGCVTGLTLPAELETPAQLFFEQFGGTNKGRGFGRLIFNMTTHRMSHPLYPYLTTNFGTGANTAYLTEVLRSFGGFDPSLGAGTVAPAGEDLETYFQIITRGYTLVSEPGAILRHLHRGDYASFRGQLHNYGVGFTAYLTKCVIDNPVHFCHLLFRLPQALDYLFSPRSQRNAKKQDSFPKELTRTELLGMLRGPFAYLHSRAHTRRIVSRFGLPAAGGAGTCET
ncbi:MAG: glycosyltransferase [Chloroflexi bacterium]|nr:glycosyltransferase [Chloroflexota bacterium]